MLPLQLVCPASAQTPEPATAPLRELHAEGSKILTEAQVVSLTSLQTGSQVGKKDLQTAADRLVDDARTNEVRAVGRFAVGERVEEDPRAGQRRAG